jgi:AraC-like DNA-binding protein/quercetin dioxygenase-like cupin family protein
MYDQLHNIRHMRQRTPPQRTDSFADRPASSPAPDVLSTALRAVRLAGHAVSETEGGAGEEFEQSSATGAVHLVEAGGVRLVVDHDDSHELHAGDVALLPAGRAHVLRVVTERAHWLTGTFALEGGRQDRLHRDLPVVIAFDGLRDRSYEWFDVSYRMLAKERSEPTPGAAVMISRILDLMYIQMLRLWASSIDGAPGWLRAGMDPNVGRVVDALHAEPARAWTTAAMASLAHMSRTTFIDRFTRLLGVPPGTYLGELRMELARDLLIASPDTVKHIAHRTGYTSDAAFVRAFTRQHGRSPAQCRMNQSARTSGVPVPRP